MQEDGIEGEEGAGDNQDPESRLLGEFPQDADKMESRDPETAKFVCNKCLFTTESFRRFKQHELR